MSANPVLHPHTYQSSASSDNQTDKQTSDERIIDKDPSDDNHSNNYNYVYYDTWYPITTHIVLPINHSIPTVVTYLV